MISAQRGPVASVASTMSKDSPAILGEKRLESVENIV